ncbi:hypothetical protein D187_002105 [Cystobacter fuscus DSM 2262]|uniref:Uncharacterized protein n=1 Tax=Cystobacter fuscus (strain ATCC 25194 / DSM 2262 / NBRC 100088 / M29) TaxID=1242864 RepID=S9QFB4_CYSF2|nr:hypothetical protein [Cystobacter fuscus]EPX60019.1 hypothetical protein D187_002105 [Cystobacter fuscus DSM 2262]
MSSLVSFVQSAARVRRVHFLLLVTTWCSLLPQRASAETYADARPIEDEAALRALNEEGVLADEDFEALRELLRTGVDLRTASREVLFALPGMTWAQVDALLAYREGGGTMEGAALVEAGLLTPARLRQLRAFLVEPERGAREVSGRVRLVGAHGAADAWVPPLLLLARVDGPWGLRAGGGVSLTRRHLEGVRYDSKRRALVAELPSVGMRLPKLYARWEGAHASVLVGTYRLGFGQRLTLDTTGRPAPDGFVPDEDFVAPGAPERRCVLTGPGACEAEEFQGRVTPDFGWTEGFRGAVGHVQGRVEDVTLSFTGFGSYQSRGLSQYELFEPRTCPSTKDARACKAPDVWASLPGMKTSSTARFVSRTLPDVFHELAGGGHARVGFSPRAHVGVTGWGAWPRWAVTGLSPDFREQARYPGGGAYGALGVDAAWGTGPVNLFLEGARSFSGPGGAGGVGVLQRTVLGERSRELEVSLRYYGRDFDNPYGRALSSPDEWRGLRASNEMGARLRSLFSTADDAWRLVGQWDVWTRPPGGSTPEPVHHGGSVRVDFQGVPELRPSVWVEHQNKALGRDGPGLCFEGDEGTSPDGEPIPCAGERSRIAGRVRFAPVEEWALAAQYQHTWMGSRQRPEGVRQDGQALVDVSVRPVSSLRLHGRVSWRDEDLAEATRLSQTLRTSLEVAWALLSGWSTRVRYEVVLDLKSPVGAVTPPESPWHVVRLDMEGSF